MAKKSVNYTASYFDSWGRAHVRTRMNDTENKFELLFKKNQNKLK